jgi:hypothetical protein
MAELEYTTFQARLSKKGNAIARKLTDSAIKRMGIPVDCIHVSLQKSATGDIQKRSISDLSLISVYFSNIEDASIKLVEKNGLLYAVPYFVNEENNTSIEVFIETNKHIKQDDLIIRVYQKTDITQTIIACYQVKEILASLGHETVLYLKYKLTMYDEVLPDQVIQYVTEIKNQREELLW